MYKDLPGKLWEVVVDPGHGGRDPGALGRVFGVHEREIVMAIALHMVDLAIDSKINIILTRLTSFQRPTLRQRVDMAQGKDAFISLHCNGFTNPEVHGTETFHWHTNAPGRILAQHIQSDLILRTGWRDRGVKPNHTFFVLRNTQSIPACLIEYNFITNPSLEDQLRLPETQRQLAAITFSALERYLYLHCRRD